MYHINYSIMKTRNHILLLAVLLSFSIFSKAQEKNESPYFVVLSDEDAQAQLPLKTTSVEVDISGVIADVQLTQRYVNTGTSTIEAIYVFPASTRSAVYAMEMLVGDRRVVAKIEEKAKARKDYDAAKKKGRTVSLLEQERPNVFTMKVGNILPGATVEVQLSYTELLVPRDKVYEFVFPTVVGPRYVSGEEKEGGARVDWAANPYTQEGEPPLFSLDMELRLQAGMPLRDLRCSTHKHDVSWQNENAALVTLQEPQGGNRDFVLQYRLAGEGVDSGVLLYEAPDGEKFFLAMVQPPERPAPEEFPPREYVFILDVSGSMYGFPLDVSKELLVSLLEGLRETDRFNIIYFSGGAEVYSRSSQSATPEHIAAALSFLENQQGSGGTELLQALQKAMTLNPAEGYARSFCIFTDGYVGVEAQTFDYIRNNLGQANFFAFGIGSSVNRHLIEGMAHVGYGEPFFALNEEEAVLEARKFRRYIEQPVLTDIAVTFDGLEVYDVLPEDWPDLFAERPLIISGKYKGEAKGDLLVSGTSGKRRVEMKVPVAAPEKESPALRYLWAREKLRLLSDYANLGGHWNRDSSLVEQITALGLHYSLLTSYTSFIAIDSLITNPGGAQNTVLQPSALPQGVSNNAVGGQPSPPSPPAVANILNIVEDDVEIESELEIYFSNMVVEEEASDGGELFYIVEEMPEFPGSSSGLQAYLSQSIQYPVAAQENGIQGRVYVSFVVDVDGSITNVKVVRSVDPLLDAEAVRIVKAMPKWKPGKQRGKPVRTTYTVPINFVLADGA